MALAVAEEEDAAAAAAPDVVVVVALAAVAVLVTFAAEELLVAAVAVVGDVLRDERSFVISELLDAFVWEFVPGTRVFVPLRMGALMFVVMLRISLPWTVSFALDFLRSSVSISI